MNEQELRDELSQIENKYKQMRELAIRVSAEIDTLATRYFEIKEMLGESVPAKEEGQ